VWWLHTNCLLKDCRDNPIVACICGDKAYRFLENSSSVGFIIMLDIDSNAYMLIYSLIVSHAYANLSVSVAIIRSHGECTVGQTKGCMAAVDRMTTTTLPAASTSITHNSGSATAHRLTSHPQSSTKLLQLLHRRSQIGCVVPLSTANLSRRLRRCRRAAFTH